MSKDIFSKHWAQTGFSRDEAERKLLCVNEAYGVYKNAAKWHPAEIVPDERGGYKVVICTK